jgi:hypothetical protein
MLRFELLLLSTQSVISLRLKRLVACSSCLLETRVMRLAYTELLEFGAYS